MNKTGAAAGRIMDFMDKRRISIRRYVRQSSLAGPASAIRPCVKRHIRISLIARMARLMEMRQKLSWRSRLSTFVRGLQLKNPSERGHPNGLKLNRMACSNLPEPSEPLVAIVSPIPFAGGINGRPTISERTIRRSSLHWIASSRGDSSLLRIKSTETTDLRHSSGNPLGMIRGHR